MKRKPVVGETLYSFHGPVTVTSVGRKFFEANDGTGRPDKYQLSDWRLVSNYSSARLYETQQEVQDVKDFHEVAAKIRQRFNTWGSEHGCTLDQLRRIKSILDEPKA